MLRRLSIRNLAIIDEIDVELGPGLNVVSGETGAGKSILVDAIALLAGARGSTDLIRDNATRLSVSGEFDADAITRRLLEEAGLPAGDVLLLRRELSPDGRGRAFVDDEPAAVRTLARMSSRLVAIQGQNSEQELTERDAPLDLLDTFAGAEPERERAASAARAWSQARAAVESLRNARRDRANRLESLDYQIREVEAVAPTPGEPEELMAERERLRHADRIRRAGEAALAALTEEEGAAADRIGEAVRAFAELAAIDPREEVHRQEAEELKRRIADLAAAARDAALAIESDPQRLDAIEHRLERIERLQKKYGPTVEQVLKSLERARSERAELADDTDLLARREKEEGAMRAAYQEAAEALSKSRQAAAPRFSTAVEKELRALAMEKAGFRVSLEPAGDTGPRPGGLENAVFLFAPNPGEPERPLERIASGGELSRLQLAIRSVAAGKKRRGRTLVFDEVDSGIGGRTAEVVGRKLRMLAECDQVLCVTHVPQIAALAENHFRAEKEEKKGRTVARLTRLEGRERLEEIARMLAGEKVPETAFRHARTLLEEGGKN